MQKKEYVVVFCELNLKRLGSRKEGLYSFISEKVVPVAGDISCEDLGLKDAALTKEMWKEVDVVVNLAATTNFDERYDIALGLNTMRPKYSKLKLLVHVSTGEPLLRVSRGG
ncbi:unnamed protein product [Rhodiola kirilowii]